jgi:hypothetical protein
LALNRIPENSRWDDEILRGVILEIQEDGENALSLGFTPNELSRILEEPDDLEVKEIETGPVDDEFWISIRGPLAQQPLDASFGRPHRKPSRQEGRPRFAIFGPTRKQPPSTFLTSRAHPTRSTP